ncbi:extracellular triacylglycerol lipase precursor [Lentinula novae-zelandiae]|nr:extracellular triacylglycerol lipase precursor [Lentinula novae-zelandiae]
MLALQTLTSLICAALGIGAASPEVQLGKTTLVGRDVTLLKQDFFGGIPFAEPPLGSLRLLPPVLKTSLNVTTFDASNFGFSCLQSSVPIAELSEDCLSINVFRPSGVELNASLPVMFWTYGGGFQAGSSAEFNASAIVAQKYYFHWDPFITYRMLLGHHGTPIVYVNFNYRLGPLGFPQGQEAANRKVLNLALHDQIAALTWVQENIGAFGGDKNKVTVFGEIAGAIMTSLQLLNPSFSKFARAATLESGSAASSLTFDAQHRQVDWDNFVAGVPGCVELSETGNTFNCLQSVNTTAILSGLLIAQSEAPEQIPWDPTIDGEGTSFIPPTVNYTTELIMDLLVTNFSPPAVPSVSETQLENATMRLLELYPDVPALGSPFNTGNDTFGLSSGYKRVAALLGDISFQSQRRLWIQTASNAGVKTFGYLFTQPQPTTGNPAYLGVSHGSEIVFVYGAPPNANASATGLSEAMIEYWVSFATSLDPNDGKGISRPTWEQYTPRNQVVMQLNGDNTTMIPDDYRKAGIDFMNSMPLTFDHRRSL